MTQKDEKFVERFDTWLEMFSTPQLEPTTHYKNPLNAYLTCEEDHPCYGSCGLAIIPAYKL